MFKSIRLHAVRSLKVCMRMLFGFLGFGLSLRVLKKVGAEIYLNGGILNVKKNFIAFKG